MERNNILIIGGIAAVIVLIGVVYMYTSTPETLEEHLLIYGAADPEDVRPWLDAFEAKYPGTTVEFVSKPPPPLYAQLQAELDAGGPTADIVMITLPIQLSLAEAGEFLAYKSGEASSFPNNFKDSEGLWTAVQINPVVLVYNSETLSSNELPKTINDLLNPTWKGRLASHDVTLGSVGTSWLATMKGVLGSKGTSFVEGLAALEPARFRAFEDVGRVVYEGEKDIGIIVYLHDLLRFQATGAPIERLVLDDLPTLFTVTPVSIMKNTESPVAAKRFVDFILSEEGQKLIGDTEVRIAARTGINAKYTLDKLLGDEELILFPNDDAFTNGDRYTTEFTALFTQE